MNAPPPALRVTLAALAACLLPYVTRLPLWASLLTFALLLLSTFLPPKRPRWQTPLLLVIALCGGAALWQHFGMLLGRDGGGAILCILVALKALETRSKRDLHALVLLGFFVTATHFFFVQDTFTALWALGSAAALCAALRFSERPDTLSARHIGGALRGAAQGILRALPLSLALFVLFPRPESPLWQMPVSSQAAASTTGLSDTVNPGTVSNLAQSDEVAFRAQFEGQTPPNSELYWRGPVLEQFDGNTWRMGPPSREGVQIRFAQPRYRYVLTAEATNKPWILALDAPLAQPAGTQLTRSLQLIKPSNVGSRSRFPLLAAPLYRYGLNEDPRWLSYDLQLPAGNPRLRALAASWRQLSAEQRVRAGLDTFRGFRYTLQPPLLPEQNGLDFFVFESKRGFCEHFASAFAFMMRAAGVPARVVTGYQGAEQNGSYLIVRQANAHAWTEVWLEGQGWLRVDPTATVSPARISVGTSALAGAPTLASGQDAPLRGLQLRLDALQNLWNTWVIGYDGAQQRRLFQMLGLGDWGSAKLGLLSVAALMLSALPLLLRRKPPTDPLLGAYALLSRRLKLPREPQETPSAYLARAQAQYPQQAAEIAALIERYQRLRYGPPPSPAEVRAFVTAARDFRVKR